MDRIFGSQFYHDYILQIKGKIADRRCEVIKMVYAHILLTSTAVYIFYQHFF